MWNSSPLYSKVTRKVRCEICGGPVCCSWLPAGVFLDGLGFMVLFPVVYVVARPAALPKNCTSYATPRSSEARERTHSFSYRFKDDGYQLLSAPSGLGSNVSLSVWTTNVNAIRARMKASPLFS
jgi:hypothetical protein